MTYYLKSYWMNIYFRICNMTIFCNNLLLYVSFWTNTMSIVFGTCKSPRSITFKFATWKSQTSIVRMRNSFEHISTPTKPKQMFHFVWAYGLVLLLEQVLKPLLVSGIITYLLLETVKAYFLDLLLEEWKKFLSKYFMIALLWKIYNS